MDGLAAEQLVALLRWIKEGPAGSIPVETSGKSLGRLRGVTWEDACDRTATARLGRWHELAFAWFPEPFSVTHDGATRWLIDRVLSDPCRVLFWVQDVRGGFVGHAGLTSMNFDAGTATIGDVIPAHPRASALVAASAEALARWTQTTLGLAVEWALQAREMAASPNSAPRGSAIPLGRINLNLPAANGQTAMRCFERRENGVALAGAGNEGANSPARRHRGSIDLTEASRAAGPGPVLPLELLLYPRRLV